MNPELRSTLFKVLIPLLGILIPLIVAKVRGFSLREFFGFQKPAGRLFALFLALWVVWMALTEVVLHWLDPSGNPNWPPYPMLVIVLRILAIGILGPIMEELIFRGVIYGKLSRRIGVPATIIAIAIAWTLLHFRYDWTNLTVVFVDGLWFGYARHKTGSVFTPMAMHVMANLFSIYQSLT